MEKDTLRNYCNTCDKQTNHCVLAKHAWSSSGADPWDIDYELYHKLVKCLGCDSVSLRLEEHEIYASFQIGEDEWDYPINITNYPKRLQNHKSLENDYVIPELVRDIYRELILALQEGAKILASLGLRACIEAVCNHLDITGRNLEVRINQLGSKGYISKKDAERLHAIRFMGNDAAHEIKAPEEYSLQIALEILEHLLKSVFILPERAKGYLDTPIDNIDSFIQLLESHLSNFHVGDEYPLGKFLEKDIRRVIDGLESFQESLITKIDEGAFEFLELGKVETTSKGGTIQYFKVCELESVTKVD